MNNYKQESAPEDFAGPGRGAEHSGKDISTASEDKEYMISESNAIEFIRSLSGQQNTITFSRAFLQITGDIPCALMLSQLVFWSGRGADPGGWVWKRDQDWNEEVGITLKQAVRARNNLRKRGLIETKIKKAFGNPTLHYRVCERKLLKSLVSYQRDETNHPKGTKRNIPLGRNETYQRDDSLTDPTTDLTQTHTQRGGCVVSSYNKCFPPQTAKAAEGLAKDVMDFVEAGGTKVRSRERYLSTLTRAAEAGTLERPVGYVAPAEREAKEAARRKVEADQKRVEAADRAKIEVAAEQFRELPTEEQERYLGLARADIGVLGSCPGLVHKRAEMLAFREGAGVEKQPTAL